jgi:hypothetical protein
MRIDYNPITGILEGKVPPSDIFLDATLFTDMSAGACIGLSEYSAFQISSNYNHDIITRSTPIIDGIVLENGKAGSQVKIAQLKGMTYSFNIPLLQSHLLTTELYVGKDGYLTLVQPTLIDGNKWLVKVGYKINDYDFIFDPDIPISLVDPGPITPPDSFLNLVQSVILAEAMPSLCCFKIGLDGLAYKISADDLNAPYIDGITLEAGGINSLIKVGRVKNSNYQTPIFFSSSDLYWLSNDGSIKTTKDIGSSYSCVVGRSTGNSNTFIFDPQLPIKLI